MLHQFHTPYPLLFDESTKKQRRHKSIQSTYEKTFFSGHKPGTSNQHREHVKKPAWIADAHNHYSPKSKTLRYSIGRWHPLREDTQKISFF